MRLTDLELRRLLPAWMQADAADIALAAGVDAAVRRTAPDLDLLSVWQALDSLPEAVLDELAWSLDVGWYDSGAPQAVKADLVRQSDLVHAKLGTVAAVESVIRSYFGSGRVKEWPEYAGEPHHFKVYSTNPDLVYERYMQFLSMLAKTKRLSSKLDAIEIGITGEGTVRAGVGVLMSDRVTYRVGYPPDPPVSIGPSGRSRARSSVAVRTTTVATYGIGTNRKEAA